MTECTLHGKQRLATKAKAFVMLAAGILAGTVTKAQNITKANNTTVLSTGSSWVGGVAPTPSNNIIFDSTLTSAASATVGNGISVNGIIVKDTGVNFTIAAKSSNTTTIGAGGIDLSSANNGSNNFTVSSLVVLGANQSFAVSTGRTLSISGAINNSGFNLTTTGAGALTLTGIITGSGNINVENNGGTFTLGGNSANFTGALNVVNGTLQAQGNNNALGTGTVTLGNATTQSGDDLAVLISSTSRNISNNITIANFGNSTTLGGATTSGTSSFSGNIVLGKDVILNEGAGGTIRFLGNISGAGNITKTGDGTITLNGTNTNSGNVLVNAGTLTMGNSNLFDDAASVVVNGGTLNLVTNSDTVGAVTLIDGCITSTSGVLTTSSIELRNGYSNVTFSGSANAYKTTGGTVTLNGTSNFTGNMVIANGTVLSQINGSLGNGTVVLGNSSTQSGDDLALLLTASGRTVTNNIIVDNFGNTSTLGSNSPSGTMTYSGTITLNKDVILTATSGNLRFLGSINGSGNITKTGDGTVFFNGTNDNAMGNVTISAGTLSITNGSAIGDNSTVSIASGANLAVTANETVGSLAGAGNVTLSNSRILTTGGNNQNTTFSGVLQGGNNNSGLAKEGNGTLLLTNANTYAGVTTVNGGTLQLGDGITSGSVAGNIANNAQVTFDLGSNQTYAGVISGSGQLTVSGSANLTLTGNNTFTGTTTVSGGTLVLAGGSNKALGGSNTIVITDGGTLLLDNSDQISPLAAFVLYGGYFVVNGQSLGSAGAHGAGTLTLSDNSTLDLGGGTSVVAFDDSSSASWTPDTVLSISGWNSGDDIYFGTSSSGLSNSQLPQIHFINPFGDGKDWGAGLGSDGRLVPVPEPATYLLGGLLTFLAAFTEWRRRRKNKS